MAARGRVVAVLFAGAVGVVSGVYIWKPLLEQELNKGPKGLEQLSKDQERSSASPPSAPATPPAEPTPSTAVQPEKTATISGVNAVVSSQAPSTNQPEPPFKRDVGQDQSVSVLSRSHWFGGSSSPSTTNSDPKKL
ncbi:hypothetical protein M407DRAFT_17804 [Tulasnella calospora MUT 4182]|uniref:Uncharacterized protein n=1 Tax=Tulasnella calospora MUT 4182 TaxID=1051891 RepID=A0A0C3LH01_9AGAM|nr:hypothetical protein M407DRAFT_17804 [Tulasnella calospora MUT 4182]